MNIDSVTVGGYSRSRCSGSSASVVPRNSGLVSVLKNATASVDFDRRSMRRRRCCKSLWVVRFILAGLRKDGLRVFVDKHPIDPWASHPLFVFAFHRLRPSPGGAAAKVSDILFRAVRMSKNRHYVKWPPSGMGSHSRRRFPVAFAPYAPQAGSLVVAPWHWSGALRKVFGQWPAASHVVCAPPTPEASLASRLRPCALYPSPPRGSLRTALRASGSRQGFALPTRQTRTSVAGESHW